MTASRSSAGVARSAAVLAVCAAAVALSACGSDATTVDETGRSDEEMVEERLDDVATDASEVSAEGADRLKSAGAALADGDFSIMAQALGASGLGDELEDRDVTILVPTDDAFADLGAGGAVDLLADPSSIDDVLKRHVLVEVYTLAELGEQTSVETMAGNELTVTVQDGVVEVDGAKVTEIDGSAESTGTGRELQVLAVDRLLLED